MQRILSTLSLALLSCTLMKDAQAEPTTWYAGVTSGVDLGGRSVGDVQTNTANCQLGLLLGYDVTPHWALELNTTTVQMPSGVVGESSVDALAGWAALSLNYAPLRTEQHVLRLGVLGGADIVSTHVADGQSVTQVDPLFGARVGYRHDATETLSVGLDADLIPLWNTSARLLGNVRLNF